MKLTAIFLLAFSVQLSAESYAQHVTLSKNNATLEQVLQEIHQQTGYLFLYGSSSIKNADGFNISIQNATVQQALDSCFTNSAIGYLIENKTIIVFPIQEMDKIFEPQHTVSGLVVSDQGVPLAGVTVRIKNSNIGTITDANGFFRISVSDTTTLLQISYLGFQSKEINVGNKKTVKITLFPSESSLNELVVVGYGTLQKANVTSAISSLSAEDIQGIPAAGADQMLQGKVPGVTVTSNTGQPGGGVSVRIRGITSVNGNQPLYVIDGVPILSSSNSIPQDQLGGVPGQSQQSVLATLNPNDIASIDILKDASAQAIYGSLGGNGVVLITTKQGKSGEGKLNYNMYYGWQKVKKRLPVMNLREYARYYNSLIGDFQALHEIDDGIGTLDSIGEFAHPSLLGAGTDWQDAVFQTGHIQNHQLSFSGGKGKTTYYFSGNYYEQTGTVIGSGFKRYTARVNVDQQVKPWLKAGFSANLSKTDQKITLTDGQQSVISLMLYNSPATPVKDFNGSYVNTSTIAGVPFGQTQNPVALALLRNVHSKQSKAFGNAYANIHFLEDFTFSNQFNYDFQLTHNSAFQPNILYPNGVLAIGPSKLRVDKNNSFYWGLQNYLSYNHTFGKHAIQAVAGHESQYSMYESQYTSVTDLTLNIESLSAGTTDPSQTGGGKYPWSMESYFARLNYTYDNRYAVSASFRRDGSSSFGPNSRWGNFSAVSAGWTITNEKFADGWNALSYLKLRLGAGAVGNQNTTGNNVYSTNIRLAANATGLFGQSGIPGIPANVGNPGLQWESVVTYNAGINATFLKNRIDLAVDVYKKITTDMILSTALPSFAGLDPNPPANAYQAIEPPVTNAGEMTNTGIDIGITSHNIQTSDFSWTTKLDFSHYKNVFVKSYSPNANPLFGKSQAFTPVTLTVTKAGQSVGSFYGFVTDGLYRSQEELEKGPTPMLSIGPQNTWLGDIRYKDLNGDGAITAGADDQTFIGNPNPDFTFGITNSFKYKNFDFSVFITGVYGDEIFNYSRMLTEALFSPYQPQLTTAMDRYSASNPNGKLPRFNQWNKNNLKISDRFIEDGSYLRIQNISFGYNLPKHLVGRIKMSNVRLFISAQNIYTFTSYSGYDPELGAFNNNVLTMNIDYGHYPNPATFMVGANIDF